MEGFGFVGYMTFLRDWMIRSKVKPELNQRGHDKLNKYHQQKKKRKKC